MCQRSITVVRFAAPRCQPNKRGQRCPGTSDWVAGAHLLSSQTHHMQCPAEPRMFPSIDCADVFGTSAKAKTCALSVLVVIEMCNALNRYCRRRPRDDVTMTSRAPVGRRATQRTTPTACMRRRVSLFTFHRLLDFVLIMSPGGRRLM